MCAIQEANDAAVALLNRRGYKGDILEGSIKRVAKERGRTVPLSKERVLALAAATTHGEKFRATGGSHLTSGDFFKSMMVPEWKRKIKVMEEDT